MADAGEQHQQENSNSDETPVKTPKPGKQKKEPKVFPPWSERQEETMMDEVRNRPILYDPQQENFKVPAIKLISWKEVAESEELKKENGGVAKDGMCTIIHWYWHFIRIEQSYFTSEFDRICRKSPE